MRAILSNSKLTVVLDQLEDAIDPVAEEELHRQWTRFTFEDSGAVFIAGRGKKAEIDIAPPPLVNETLEFTDDGLANMLTAQYTACLRCLKSGSGALLTVRGSYGVGILPSVFGCEPFLMAREQDCLPNVRPLGGSAIPALLDRGGPDVRRGYGERVFAVGELFLEIAERYPQIGTHVHPIHPDLQGPFDVAELLWGSDLFYALYDQPETVHALLDLICGAYSAFMEKWQTLFPAGEYAYHWGNMHRGALMLRDDSAMNLPPELCREFILPYDNRLLARLGGGAVHFCGRGDHYIELLSGMERLYAVALSQPECNDMETIYRHTVDKGIRLLNLRMDVLLRDRERLGGMACGIG